jgi:hypothetical protein
MHFGDCEAVIETCSSIVETEKSGDSIRPPKAV